MSPKEFADIMPAYLKAAEALRNNPGQWAAYESRGNCVLLAGPGSGKTKTLITKMARLLNEEVKSPQGIACITYSTECARELEQRLDALGIQKSKNVFIGTVHSFCLNNIIRPYANLAGLPITDPIVIPDRETWYSIFERAAIDTGIREKPSNMISRFDRHRRTYLDRGSPEWKEKDEQLSAFIEAYEESLHSKGFLDFDDMVLMSLRLVKECEWVRKAIRARFPILIVDEYQDLGLPLHEIVVNLCIKADVRILAVGDPDQSVYGFSGANPRLLIDLARMPNFQAISLRMNYRCGRTIVAGSIATLGQRREYEAALDHEGTINFWECPNCIEEQAEVICNSIIPAALKQRPGRTLGDIAVLYIDKYDCAVITKTVKKSGLKYVGGDRETRYKATPLTRFLEDCAAWCSGGWKIGKPRPSYLVHFWSGLNEFTSQAGNEKILRRTLIGFLWSHRDPNEPLIHWLTEFLQAGLSAALQNTRVRPDELESFKQLYEAASDPEKLGEFSVSAFGGLCGTSEHLNLVTLHSSKGLEFDVVVMMGMDQGRLPSWGATTPESKREPRRLFYVGLTRARHDVHLVYSGWYKNQYNKAFKSGPSEFVNNLRESMNTATPAREQTTA